MNECFICSGWMVDRPMITGTSRSRLELIMGAALWNLGKQGNGIRVRSKFKPRAGRGGTRL